jgi:pimeloyl-ACP methyl ester carboxylesterase
VKSKGVDAFAEGFVKSAFSQRSFVTYSRIIDETKKIIAATSPTGICGALLAMAGRTDTTEALAKIKIPTLIMVGEHDVLTPPAVSRMMSEKIPHSQLHVIQNAGHMSNVENTEDFNRQIGRFLVQ